MSLGPIQEFDHGVDLSQAILWQYDVAPNLQALISGKQAWYDQSQKGFWEDWYRDVFDLRTANDFGLTVWALILDVPLVADAPATEDRPVFGFGPHNLNFYQSNFGRDVVGAIALTTEQKRLILRLRYFQLVSTGSVTDIDEMLAFLFADQGLCYVLDGLDMTMEYVFRFFPNARMLYVFENFDVLPRPAGVRLRILVNPGNSFGFDPFYLNFNSNFGG
jgi:hypothetical protein